MVLGASYFGSLNDGWSRSRALFDKLIFALLLKLMKMKVAELVRLFQPIVFILVLIVFGVIFLGLIFINAFRIARMNAFSSLVKKASGEKRKDVSWIVQTILGLISLGAGCHLAVTVENPLSAVLISSLTVLLVILGTYLLFNAGITVFLQIFQEKQALLLPTQQHDFVSNLISIMKKNASWSGDDCYSLNHEVLVTMSAATKCL